MNMVSSSEGLEFNTIKGRISNPLLSKEIEITSNQGIYNLIFGNWSPEQLLMAAITKSYISTFINIAEKHKLRFSYFECVTRGKIEIVEGKVSISEISLEPTILMLNKADRLKAEKIVNEDKSECVIANNILSRISITPTFLTIS